MNVRQINSFQDAQNYIRRTAAYIFDSYRSMDTDKQSLGTETTLTVLEAVRACCFVNEKFQADRRTEKFLSILKNKKSVLQQQEEYAEVERVLAGVYKRWLYLPRPKEIFKHSPAETAEINIRYWTTEGKVLATEPTEDTVPHEEAV